MRNLTPRMTIVLVALALTAVAFAGVAKDAPETVVIDKAAAKKSAVTFPHKAHLERVECATCHHNQEGLAAGSDAEVQPCSACHLDPEKAETPSMRQMSLTKNPFHKLCIDCHKKEAKGPTKCDECHPKQ